MKSKFKCTGPFTSSRDQVRRYGFVCGIERNAKTVVFTSRTQWKELPTVLSVPDINGDTLPDVVLYGEDVLGVSKLEVFSYL